MITLMLKSEIGQGQIDLIQLENIVKYTKGQVHTLVQNKKKFIATDKATCMTVFEKLRTMEKFLQNQ